MGYQLEQTPNLFGELRGILNQETVSTVLYDLQGYGFCLTQPT